MSVLPAESSSELPRPPSATPHSKSQERPPHHTAVVDSSSSAEYRPFVISPEVRAAVARSAAYLAHQAFPTADPASDVSRLLVVVLIYDVMCQWIINAARRERLWPENLRLQERTVVPAIGKLHLPAHKEECHAKYSLNYIPGVGRSDGEWIERSWVGTNEAGPSTKAMGPGARHDRIDEITSYHNHRKCMALGKLFPFLIFYLSSSC